MCTTQLMGEVSECEEHVQDLLRKYTPYLKKYEKLLNQLETTNLIDTAKSSQLRNRLAQDWATLKCIAAIFGWKYTNEVWVREEPVLVYYDFEKGKTGRTARWPDRQDWKVYLDHWELVRTVWH